MVVDKSHITAREADLYMPLQDFTINDSILTMWMVSIMVYVIVTDVGADEFMYLKNRSTGNTHLVFPMSDLPTHLDMIRENL